VPLEKTSLIKKYPLQFYTWRGEYFKTSLRRFYLILDKKMRDIWCLFLLASAIMNSQEFTKPYLMAFHTCGPLCDGPQTHTVQLAESSDGLSWNLVAGFPSYSGSVPDIITRPRKLYIYTPGRVSRYDAESQSWDAGPQNVFITTTTGEPVQYVDPSAYLDDQGRIVLFFLNTTGFMPGTDPAFCTTYPCHKIFDAAIEIPGSDGTQFVLAAGHRLDLQIDSGTASDPDIYFDGTRYIMLISRGSSSALYTSSTLLGDFEALYAGNPFFTNMGGIPCGYFDPLTQHYWTWVHRSENGSTSIRMNVAESLIMPATIFNTVISGATLFGSAEVRTESPSFTLNYLMDFCKEEANIYGEAIICNTEAQQYYTDSEPATLYQWIVSSGSIISGQQTAQITWSGAEIGTGNVRIIKIKP